MCLYQCKQCACVEYSFDIGPFFLYFTIFTKPRTLTIQLTLKWATPTNLQYSFFSPPHIRQERVINICAEKAKRFLVYFFPLACFVGASSFHHVGNNFAYKRLVMKYKCLDARLSNILGFVQASTDVYISVQLAGVGCHMI